MEHKCKRSAEHYRDGSGLVALEAVDLKKVQNFDDLLRAMSKASFGARNIGESADVLEAMIKDENCVRIITCSGALTVAKMGLILRDMLEAGWFDIMISTGALITHGLSENIGCTHFKPPLDTDDVQLYELGYNRVYDTIELEKSLDNVEEMVREILARADPAIEWSSNELVRAIGRYLQANQPENIGIVRTAYDKNIPIFIPAFTDSELGLDFYLQRYYQRMKNQSLTKFSSILDLEKYAGLILDAIKGGKSLGIFTLGGGVPRNWAQQVGPTIDLLRTRLGQDFDVQARFKYAVRICDAPVTNGGLSGCTYREGVSWGKFVPQEEGGMNAEIIAEVTQVLPPLIKGLMQRLGVHQK